MRLEFFLGQFIEFILSFRGGFGEFRKCQRRKEGARPARYKFFSFLGPDNLDGLALGGKGE